ncbi:MAG: translation initiation factor IF-3, partial [Duodenibacillus sp.]|nr:translation initiation factor IF-3 [Duodenibacillus sp.]
RTVEALRMAEEQDVDLVEVAPNAQPPVCRLMNYGKFRYQEQKKAQQIKSNQKVVQIKEVKFRPATDENDYQTKLRSLRRFLAEGNKAKVTLRYRGREMSYQDQGMEIVNRIREDLGEEAQVEQMPKLEGRQMIMVLAPKRKK